VGQSVEERHLDRLPLRRRELIERVEYLLPLDRRGGDLLGSRSTIGDGLPEIPLWIGGRSRPVSARLPKLVYGSVMDHSKQPRSEGAARRII
jgi:hypothetical protein